MRREEVRVGVWGAAPGCIIEAIMSCNVCSEEPLCAPSRYCASMLIKLSDVRQ